MIDQDFIQVATSFLTMVGNDLDAYTTRSSEVKTLNSTSVALFTPSHIQFAKYGRGAGKMPPIDPILEWVKAKGIVTDDKEARGTAWAIAKSISKNGTKNYTANAPNAIEESLANNLNTYMESMGKIIVDDIAKRMEDLTVLPDNIKKFKL